MVIASVVLFLQVFQQADPFTGTWRITAFPLPKWTLTLEVAGGVFRSSFGNSSTELPLDGTDHEIPGQHTIRNIRRIDDHVLEEMSKSDDRNWSTTRYALSSDGTRLVILGKEYRERNPDPIITETTCARAGNLKRAVDPFNGRWKPVQLRGLSDTGSLIRIQSRDGEISLHAPSGEYTARYDGKLYPYYGDPTGDAVKLTRIDSNKIREQKCLKGKPVRNLDMTVSHDDTTMILRGRWLNRKVRYVLQAKKE